MEYVGIDVVKNVYQDELHENGNTKRAEEVKAKSFTEPVFEGYEVHPEEEPSLKEMQASLSEISIDLFGLDSEFIQAANNYNNLMTTVQESLKAVDEAIAIEQERINDINMICGNYQEFSSVRTLTQSDLSGTCSYLNDDTATFTTGTSSRSQIEIKAINVNGNGYEGNAYVHQNGKLIASTASTADRDYMTDSDELTAYEYSRITASKKDNYPAQFSVDNVEAKCTITLQANDLFNTIKINSDIDNILLEDALVSDDDVSYTSVLKQSRTINKKEKMYNYSDYIYGSGVICFPSTRYLRLQLSSGGTTRDEIGFNRTIISGDDKKTQQFVRADDAKRHVVRINDIKAMTGTYSRSSYLETEELIGTSPVQSIAVFSDEYIPDFFPDNDNYITYTLTINGQDYPVVPINSDKEGTKVIRNAEYLAADDYVLHLNEPIRSAYLKVNMKTPNQSYSPYLTNLKICLGKPVVS